MAANQKSMLSLLSTQMLAEVFDCNTLSSLRLFEEIGCRTNIE